ADQCLPVSVWHPVPRLYPLVGRDHLIELRLQLRLRCGRRSATGDRVLGFLRQAVHALGHLSMRRGNHAAKTDRTFGQLSLVSRPQRVNVSADQRDPLCESQTRPHRSGRPHIVRRPEACRYSVPGRRREVRPAPLPRPHGALRSRPAPCFRSAHAFAEVLLRLDCDRAWSSTMASAMDLPPDRPAAIDQRAADPATTSTVASSAVTPSRHTARTTGPAAAAITNRPAAPALATSGPQHCATRPRAGPP